jgi:hypothetical protein
LDLFKKLDSVVTTSEGGKISGPTNVSHETHVGLTDGGGFAIDNIPPSWLSLFIDAGVTEAELRDPSTAMMLMGIVADKVSGTSTRPKASLLPSPSPTAFVASAPSPAFTPSPVSAPPVSQTVPAKAPAQQVAANNSPPRAPPMAPPIAIGVKPPVSVTGPPPPAPRLSEAPFQVPGPVAPSSTSALLEQIQKGKELKKAAVDDPSLDLTEMTNDDKNDLTDVLMRAINEHRKNLKIDAEDEEEEGFWDD